MTDETLRTGALVGDRYRLHAILGKGGMGVVWGARDERDGTDVAIKVMGPVSNGGVERVDRFLREARLAASIEHPNVVRVLDLFALPDGSPILVMERLDGESLRARLERLGHLPVGEACAILAQVVSAVGAAHERGVIHRDLKPENVFLVGDSVRVLDFGIAKLVTPEGEAMEAALTTTGAVLGTPQYMSPEQAMAERNLDARTDVWSLGVILYECLSGKRPVEERSVAYVLRQVALGQLTPLAVVAPDTPAPLLDLVTRMLATSRDQRPADLREVLEVLRPYSALDVRAFSAATRPNRRFRRMAGVFAVVAIAALGLIAGAMRATQARRVRSQEAAAPACHVARDCMVDGGAPAVCRSGACVALQSEDCEVHADPAVVGDDRTVWLGAMFPRTTDGALELDAVDLARLDFDQTMGIYARSNPDAHARPFGVLACDDRDAMRAARHLVNDVGVPAVLGLNTAAEVIDVATGVLLPHRALAIVSRSQSPLVTSIPTPPGEPRLVWRVTYSSADVAAAIGHAVTELFEPGFRASGTRRGSAPMHVALLRSKPRGGTTLSGLLLEQLRFNGRGALQNGDAFREVTVDEDASATNMDRETVQALADFAPDLVILAGNEPTYTRVVEPLEQQWKPGAIRPNYLLITQLVPETRAWVGATAERRRRFFGFEPVFSGDVNARFVMHFNETFPVKVTPDFNTNSSYDAFYLAAYATYALGDATVSGASLARAIARLVPTGKPIAVGPANIYAAYETLRAGGSIDLEGSMGSLDFNLATGEAPSDQALLCTDLDPATGLARNVESGVVYRGRSGKLEGSLRCP